jgi:hypothetical protein
MKKIAILMLLVFVFASFAFAGNALTETVVNQAGAKLVSASAIELFKIQGLGRDSAANTLTVRAIEFYNNVSIMVSDSPGRNYMFSVTLTVGTYLSDFVWEGVISSNWGGPIFNGITFSNGLVLSPTVATDNNAFIIQYQ